MTSLSTAYAMQALHRLAVSLPTSRDLILATGAVQTLVRLLRDSQGCAHYALAKVRLKNDKPLSVHQCRTS